MNVYLHFLPFAIIVLKSVTGLSQSDVHPHEATNLFKRLFKLRRAEQLEAVKRIISLGTEDKQKRMVLTAADKIFTMIKKNRVILENSGFLPGVSDFPVDEDIIDALSNLLENTALISDIILRLPDISQTIFASHYDWSILLAWSLQFANQTKLLDKQTYTLIDLVSQEMNFTVRRDEYINPYKKLNAAQRLAENAGESLPPKKKKKVKEKIRGPRMTSQFMGDL